MTLPLSTEQRKLLNLSVKALPALLTPEQQRELQALSHLARRVRHASPIYGKTRRASHDLDALLLQYRARGVSLTELARVTYLTERALRTRLPPAHELPPLRLPDPTTPEPLPEFLIVWPGTSTARRHWTYVDDRSELPARLVYSNPLLSQAHPLPLPYVRLSPQRALEELGWSRTDPVARLIPDSPLPTHGGEPAPAPYQEELSA